MSLPWLQVHVTIFMSWVWQEKSLGVSGGSCQREQQKKNHQQHGSQGKSHEPFYYTNKLEIMDMYKLWFTTDDIISIILTQWPLWRENQDKTIIAIQTLVFVISFCYSHTIINLFYIVFYLSVKIATSLQKGNYAEFLPHAHRQWNWTPKWVGIFKKSVTCPRIN